MALEAAVPSPAGPTAWWALHVTGDLDLATAHHLGALIGRATALHGGDGLIVDLGDVAFMDCAGLRPLLVARNRLVDRFCLRRVRPRTRHLLHLLGVADTLRILPGQELWPAEADPLRCGVVPNGLVRHRPGRHVGLIQGDR